MLDDGTYELRVPQNPILAGTTYLFQSWSDGTPQTVDNTTKEVVRTINLNSALSIEATFTEVNILANVTFTGTRTVTPSPTPSGETITIIVTKPDTTKDTFTTLTGTGGIFSIVKQYTVTGSYSAVASVASVPAAQSPSVPFTISAGTLTLTVAVA